MKKQDKIERKGIKRSLRLMKDIGTSHNDSIFICNMIFSNYSFYHSRNQHTKEPTSLEEEAEMLFADLRESLEEQLSVSRGFSNRQRMTTNNPYYRKINLRSKIFYEKTR